MANELPVLGVDCGDVIFFAWGGGRVRGSFDALRDIVRSGHFKEIRIISKANLLTRVIFLARLRFMNFWGYTGIPRNNLHFCFHYEDKAAICVKYSVTHFVDDRLRVMQYLTTAPHRYLLRAGGPRAQEAAAYAKTLNEVTPVNSWSELRTLL
jgi:hypothetical protein